MEITAYLPACRAAAQAGLYHQVDMHKGRWLGFMSDIPSQLSQIFHTRPLSIALMEIDHQQKISDQSRKQLHQDTVRVSGDLSALRAARKAHRQVR